MSKHLDDLRVAAPAIFGQGSIDYSAEYHHRMREIYLPVEGPGVSAKVEHEQASTVTYVVTRSSGTVSTKAVVTVPLAEAAQFEAELNDLKAERENEIRRRFDKTALAEEKREVARR